MTESVWDYPRPPAVVPCERHVRVEHGGEVIAESDRALRVLETSSPPTIYVPPQDVRLDLLEEDADWHRTHCEWKGHASYLDVLAPDERAERAAWVYRDPVPAYARLRDHIAFYPARVDGCFLGDERVGAQEGDFYGGWVTADIEGPFKGAPGTLHW